MTVGFAAQEPVGEFMDAGGSPPPPLPPPPQRRALKRQETFRTAMRQNAAEYDAALEKHNEDIFIGNIAADPDAVGLNFREFCALVRSRETGEHTVDELRKRFRLLDVTGSGRIEKHEYLRFSMRDALARSVTKISEIFQRWDEDGNGTVDEKEFRRAILTLGFSDVPVQQIDQIFREFDEDRSGSISRFEIEKRLRKFAGVIVEQKHELRRLDETIRERTGAALSNTVKLDRESEKPIAEQLREVLAANMVRVIDLFRDWDEDHNGLVDKDEFFKGITALGVEATRVEAEALFEEFDLDGGGTIEYKELNKLLRQRMRPSRLRRVASEPLRLHQLMPPGPTRASFRSHLAASQSQTTLTPLGELGQSSTVGHGLTSSNYALTSTLRANPFAYLSTFPPQRLDINERASQWWAPMHGQDWRRTRSKVIIKLPPVARAAP